MLYFYPRSPCGERHEVRHDFDPIAAISIHALLAESDPLAQRPASLKYDFYPRSPCGERRNGALALYHGAYFYPRSPCGERQPTTGILGFDPLISIHALLAESDILYNCILTCFINFYPRSPCGERQRPLCRQGKGESDFYPRSPCGERLHTCQYFFRDF